MKVLIQKQKTGPIYLTSRDDGKNQVYSVEFESAYFDDIKVLIFGSK